MKILSLGKWLALVLALLIVGFASPLAGAGSASLRISGTAFRPENSSVGFAEYGGAVYATSNPLYYWSAPVYLPQGAVVTSVRMFYVDNTTTYNCSGSFVRFDFAALATAIWLVSSSGSSNLVAYADTAAINHTIDYSKYAYKLRWFPNVANNYNMMLVGFQIFYTPPPGRAAVIPLY